VTARRRRLRLPPPDPAINIAEEADPTTGEVRYRFRGLRAAGTIIISPELRGIEEPIPTAVYVQFGEHAARDHERADPPVINGVPLTGGVVLTPAEYLARSNPILGLHRPTGPYTSTQAPDATRRYGSAIVRALLATWYARPDRDDLIRTAARRTAAGRLANLHRYKIKAAEAEIERLQRELLDHYRLAGELHKLAREHEAREREASQP
jgi:hypothetical protein